MLVQRIDAYLSTWDSEEDRGNSHQHEFIDSRTNDSRVEPEAARGRDSNLIKEEDTDHQGGPRLLNEVSLGV